MSPATIAYGPMILIGPRLDDRAVAAVAGHVELGKPKVMRSTIDAFDDRIGSSFQLIMQSAPDQLANDRFGGVITMQGKARHVGLPSGTGQCLVHGFDDVAANAKVTQYGLNARFQMPLGRSDRLGEAQSFKLRHAAD